MCGAGREIIRLGCYKNENNVTNTEVDLEYCDHNEIIKANSTFKPCDTPCYTWKAIQSQVFFLNFSKINSLY